MARTFHTFDAIVIGSAQEGFSLLREMLTRTRNVMFIDASGQQNFGYTDDVMVLEAIRRTGEKAGFKVFAKHLRAVWQEMEERTKEGWKGISHYCVSGKVAFESAQSIRLNGKLLHAKSIILQPGSEPAVPQGATESPRNKVFSSRTLVKLKSAPAQVNVEGETPIADGLRDILGREAGKPQKNDSPVVILATEQRPSVKSLQLEKVQAPLDEHGIPRVDGETGKVEGKNLFILEPQGGEASRKKLLDALFSTLK